MTNVMNTCATYQDEPIAIVGVACRFPGGVTDLASFWDLLREGRDAVTELPEGRFSRDRFASAAKNREGHSYTLAAGIIPEIKEFDADFFGISRKEALTMDPQQRLVLETSWEALENAHILPSSLKGSDTGVFVGASSMDMALHSSDDPCLAGPYSMTGCNLSIIANRVSYFYDLRGPSLVIDTACSSSLVAVHQACSALRRGEISLAFAGGVNMLMSPSPYIGFSRARMLSPDGRCKVFDASGNGFVRSEGVGVILLKPLHLALRDQNRVLALVAGTGVNSDGRTTGIALPNQKAQIQLMEEVYQRFGLNKTKLVYMEAHGTGTAAGDPLEAGAIGTVFGKALKGTRPLYVGSVKSNIGHLEPASGMAGLLKSLLVLNNNKIPPNLHLKTPNPAIDFKELNIRVPQGVTALPKTGGDELISINSFGFGGTNAHVVLQRAARHATPRLPAARSTLSAPFLLSARSAASLRALADSYASFLEQAGDNGDALRYDAAATLAGHREAMAFRAVADGGTLPDVCAQLKKIAKSEGKDKGLVQESLLRNTGGVFAFSGNGSQWSGMGASLMRESKVFRRAMDEVDAHLSPLQGWSIKDALENPERYEDVFDHTEKSQPLLFAVQVGIVKVLESKGILPSAVIGHSVGEVAAAWCCRSLSLADACRVIHYRSHLQAPMRGTGSMAVAVMPADKAEKLIREMGLDIEIAAVNTATSLSLSGDTADLLSFMDRCKSLRIAAKMLSIPYPFHTRRMEAMKEAFYTGLGSLKARKPAVPYFSAVYGREYAAPLGIEYWWGNIRQPALFAPAVAAAFAAGRRLFMEISPSPILRSYMRDVLRDEQETHHIFITLQRNKNELAELDELWKTAWKHGWTLNMKAHFPLPHKRVDLPHYPWNREHIWAESTPECREFMLQERIHPLLGWQLPGKCLIFENFIHTADYPWLKDHQAGASTPYPAAAFLEGILAAAREAFPATQLELERVSILRPLALSDESAKALRTTIDREDGGFTLEGRAVMSTEAWSKYAKGRIVPVADTPAPSDAQFRTPDSFGVAVEKSTLYAAADRFMLHYGPCFQTVRRAWVRSETNRPEVLASLEEADPSSARGMLIPPPLLDGAFQTLFILLGSQSGNYGHSYLPSDFERVVLYAADKPAFAHARLERISPRSVVASFTLLDTSGKILLQLKGCRFRRAAWLELDRIRSAPYIMELVPSAHPADIRPLANLSSQGLNQELRSALQSFSQSAKEDSAQSVHPYLLLQLASLTAMHEAVLSIRPASPLPQSFSIRELIEAGDVAASQEPWLTSMLERLENANLASRNDGVWQVRPRGERPSATTLWRTILSTAPGYATEAALLAYVSGKAKRFLENLPENHEVALLPARLTRAYFTQSCQFHPYTAILTRCAKAVLNAAQTGQGINVLQVAKNPEHFLPEMLPLFSKSNARCVVAEPSPEQAEIHAQMFSAHPAVSFTELAPDNPPVEHLGRYHCILLALSLHEHAHGKAALAGCLEMLAPGGVLCVMEHAPSLFADFVFGARPSWWAASLDNSMPVSLLQEPESWKQQLLEAGFADVDVVDKGKDPAGPAFILLARKPLPAGERSAEQPEKPAADHANAEKRPSADGLAPSGVAVAASDTAHGTSLAETRTWLLVAGEAGSPGALLGKRLLAALSEHGEEARLSYHDKDFDPSRPEHWQGLLGMRKGKKKVHLVYLVGFDNRSSFTGDELARVQQTGLEGLHALATVWDALRLPLSVQVIGGGAFADGLAGTSPLPSQGALLGFTRVMANEMRGLEIRYIDFQGEHAAGGLGFTGLVRELLDPTRETEVVFSRELRSVPRLTRLHSGLSRPRADQAAAGACLAFDTPGRLQNLYWKTMPLPKPGPDEVCVEVKYTGLNFRDVMWCMGMLPDEALENGFSGPTMGIECSGVITAVGNNVRAWSSGDEVVCFAPACFSTHVVTKASAVVAKPASLGFAEAATIPVPFITAWYSLKHLANMQPGEKVLIHGAAGGVGLAAVQIANHLGLEIYATAGAEEKHAFLKQFGVKHIFSSRSLRFVQEVLEATNGQGVDAVLNSLAGEAIPAGLAVLKPFGRFLELGKRDFYADTPMRLRPFSNNLSYFGVDVDQLLVHQPELAQKLFSELMALFEARKFIALPHTVFPAAKVLEAFQTMQQSAHIGKIVLSLKGASLLASPPESPWKKISLNAEATYLISGGTGGFGLATAQRLAKRGARHLVLLSRNGLNGTEAEETVNAMREKGIHVHIVKADVADKGKLKRALKRHLAALPPLRGVIHAAALLDDGIITSLTPERIRGVLAAKSLGAWNLHELTITEPLDFFVLYSSAVSLFGNPGQASYVAANCMEESLAAWRRSLGLPAQVIGWGAIDDTGMITRNPKARQMLLSVLGVSPTHSRDALYWLEHCIAADIGESHYFGVDWQNRADLPALAAPRFSRLRPKKSASGEAEGPSLEHIRALPKKEAVSAITAILIAEVAHVLHLPKDKLAADTPLVSLGMDSLMAVELGLAVEQKFQLTGYTMPLSEHTTPLSLAESLFSLLSGQEDEEAAPDAEAEMIRSLEKKHGMHLPEGARARALEIITKDSRNE